MDGLEGYIRQANAMEGGPGAQARVVPVTANAGRYATLLQQLKVGRGVFASRAFAGDAGVTLRQDERRWWNL